MQKKRKEKSRTNKKNEINHPIENRPFEKFFLFMLQSYMIYRKRLEYLLNTSKQCKLIFLLQWVFDTFQFNSNLIVMTSVYLKHN